MFEFQASAEVEVHLSDRDLRRYVKPSTLKP